VLDIARVAHVFLDDGGVLNDNRLRAPQWQRLVGEFFPPRLGGEAAAWSEANRDIVSAGFDNFNHRVQDWDESRDFLLELRSFEIEWLRAMCAQVGVSAPPSDGACFELATEANAWISPQVQAALPGAIDAVHALVALYPLSTASGGPSYELAMHFQPMGIGQVFQNLYGPDLVNWPKSGPEFYRRIFADAGVDSASALVVESSTRGIEWACEAGAQAVHVTSEEAAAPEADLALPALGELPLLLRS
jgi:beta-phosphoglucomutase-like phosphatase (HAD superfamily)